MTNPKGIIMLRELAHLYVTLKRTTLTVIDSRVCDGYRVLRGKEKGICSSYRFAGMGY